jgi:hypothetical protein
VIIPLVYLLSPFIPSFLSQVAGSLVSSDLIFAGVLFILIFAISKPARGILSGVAFWTVARAIRESSLVRDYMIMSALGMVVLFVSSQGTYKRILSSFLPCNRIICRIGLFYFNNRALLISCFCFSR